jgi:phosphoribosylcarboxyaminoimidazole (NCAIR) mutase
MPPGVPVATMGVGKSGATNAGIFAVQVLALSDEGLMRKLADYKEQLEKAVAEKSRKIQEPQTT